MKRKQTSTQQDNPEKRLKVPANSQLKIVELLDEALAGKISSLSQNEKKTLIKQRKNDCNQRKKNCLNGVQCSEDVLVKILDFLNVMDLQVIKLVSSNFYQLASKDGRYEKVMREEFPIYCQRLDHLKEFDGLMIKWLKRRFVKRNSERLFWWIVEKSNKKHEKVAEMIVNYGLFDIIELISDEFLKAKQHLFECGMKDEFYSHFEDDCGEFAISEIISKGEEFFKQVCKNPELGMSAFKYGYQEYMYCFFSHYYIPMQNYITENDNLYEKRRHKAIKALISGFEVFKNFNQFDGMQ